MTTIRARCPSCGDVQLRAEDLMALAHINVGEVESYTYNFLCQGCGVRVSKDASKRIFELLTSSGVKMIFVGRAKELDEVHDGPKLVPDDLLDFHEALENTHYITDVLDSEAHSEGNRD